MIGVVLDTNVLVSANIAANSLEALVASSQVDGAQCNAISGPH